MMAPVQLLQCCLSDSGKNPSLSLMKEQLHSPAPSVLSLNSSKSLKTESKKKKKKIQKTNESKSWFFEKINKIEKPLIRFTKKKRERTQINKIRNEKEEIRTNTKEIQKIVRKYYEQLCANKLGNLGEIDKFLETYNLPK